MPLNKTRLKALQKQYGKDKGERIAYAMETKAKHKKKR